MYKENQRVVNLEVHYSCVFSLVMSHLIYFVLKAWLQWKEMQTAASCQKEKESRAAFHFISRLKRRALHQWIRYVSYRHTKKETQGHYKIPTQLS